MFSGLDLSLLLLAFSLIFIVVSRLQLLYSTIDKTSRLLPCPGYYKQTAMNIGIHVSLSILVSSVCMPSSGIAGSFGSSVCSFLRNLYTVL